jgi:hypothetical protein
MFDLKFEISNIPNFKSKFQIPEWPVLVSAAIIRLCVSDNSN